MGTRTHFAGCTVGLLAVWVIVAAFGDVLTEPLIGDGVADPAGLFLGLLAGGWTWRWWHRDATSFTRDPKGYVRRVFGLSEATHHRWSPRTAEEEATVGRLTAELDDATYVRSHDDGTAEVLGTTGDVVYRYRVDSAGSATLLERDPTNLWQRRVISGILVAGLSLSVGSFVPILIWHRDGRIPKWLGLIMIGGLVLVLLSLAASSWPRRLLPRGVRWDQLGSGWADGDELDER